MRLPRHGWLGLILALQLVGCISATAPGAKNAVTSIPAETATPAYWIAKPATVSVAAADYDQLWNACDAVAHGLRFSIERTDYRDGVLTTVPLVSKQFFEPWRHDVQSVSDLAKSSLGTYRRTVRFEIVRSDSGQFVANIKVLIERSSSYEHRATTAIEYNEVFDGFPKNTKFYSDDGTVQQQQTWYAVGRDPALEAEIGQRLTDEVHDESH